MNWSVWLTWNFIRSYLYFSLNFPNELWSTLMRHELMNWLIIMIIFFVWYHTCRDPKVAANLNSNNNNNNGQMMGRMNGTSGLHNRYVVKPMLPLGSKRSSEAASNCFDSTLLIRDTDLSDERDYTLVIENERGSQEGIVQLRVVTPLSATLLIAIALSIVIVIFVISVITLMLIRRKRKGSDDDGIRDQEAKDDAQGIQSSQNPSSVVPRVA